MKTVLLTLALASGFVGARRAWFPCGPCNPSGPSDVCGASASARSTSLTGRYVEARTASVFAGACHYSSEYTTQGRRAVFGLTIDAGAFAGVDLAGVSFAAAIAADGNLADANARRSVVFVSLKLEPERADAIETFCRRELGDVLGTIDRIERVPLLVRIAGERYEVAAGDALALSGGLEPDRACCSMPQNVWYRPLVTCDDAIVGASEHFAFAVAGLGARFERADENNAFVGRVSWPAAALDPGCAAPRG